MKKYAFIAAAVAVIAALSFVLLKPGGSVAALNINDLRSDPTAFTGELTVTGIMAAVSPSDPQIIGIMDKSELLCTSATCNKFYLPVRFTGQRPAFGDEVLVTGVLTEGGRLFSATTINVVRNHKL
jgi:hypothetical protein